MDKRMVKSRIKHPLLLIRSPFSLYSSQKIVPFVGGIAAHEVESIKAAEIAGSLLPLVKR